MTIVAMLLALLLAVIAVVHALWGLRIWWPMADEQSLARTVVGSPGITRMPAPYLCHLVALALVGAAVVALQLGGVTRLPAVPGWFVQLVAVGFALVLLLRGVGGYFPSWSARTPEEPFRSYDRRYYSPLCIALGLGFAALAWPAANTWI